MERLTSRQAIEKMALRFAWYLPLLGLRQVDEAKDRDWESLPLITASVLETHYYSDRNPLAGRDGVHGYQTSGTSSGRRKSIYYSEPDEEHYIRIKLDVFRTILGTSYRTAMADMGTGHAEATAVDVFRRLGMEVESVLFRQPVERHIERLSAFKPEVLYTMPSILDRILHASENPASYGIRHVILVGEIASPAWIERTADRLGIGKTCITDTYGSIEIGTIAYFSHEHGRYLLAEGLVAEGLRPEEIGADLEPLADDEERVLVLTSAVRDAFPAVRYVTYDVVRDLRPVRADGRSRQSFQSIVKRIGPDLKHGEKISIYDIESVVFRHLEQASVQVKVAGNALIVYIHGPQPAAEQLEQIRHDLENRIPEIGTMIRSGLLDRIQVLGGTFEDEAYRGAVKNKKIVYE